MIKRCVKCPARVSYNYVKKQNLKEENLTRIVVLFLM